MVVVLVSRLERALCTGSYNLKIDLVINTGVNLIDVIFGNQLLILINNCMMKDII